MIEHNIRRDGRTASTNRRSQGQPKGTRRSKRKQALATLLLSALLALTLTACSSASTANVDASSGTSTEEQTPLANTSQGEKTTETDQHAADGDASDTEGTEEPAAAEPNSAPEATSESPDAPSASSSATADNASTTSSPAPLSWDSLPAYDGSPYVYVNNGEPTFSSADRKAAYGTEVYGDLDKLGRCTDAFAVVGPETQPTEERGSIGSVKPSGWQLAKYDFVDGKYLFNRCHLLGYQLTGENANVCNLITGTRYLNIDGMLPFENAVDDYIDATGNHVLMRVTPIFAKKELVARGVQMQAESLEDKGDGISFNVFCYNVQPGVVIDYATGDNKAASDAPGSKISSDNKGSSSSGNKGSSNAGSSSSNKGSSSQDNADTSKSKQSYVLNTNTKKFHVPSCSSVKQMADKNREDVKDTRKNILNRGYDPCKRCNP